MSYRFAGPVAIAAASIALWLCACSKTGNSTSSHPYFNADEKVYYMPQQQLVYRLSDIESLVVADPQALPDQMSMCVVDTSAMVSVMLLNMPEFPTNQQEADRMVNLISAQDNTGYSVERETRFSQSTFLNAPAWNFDVRLRLTNDADTISVIYYGHIFNKAAIVTTVQSDTVPYMLLNNYIRSLQRVDD